MPVVPAGVLSVSVKFVTGWPSLDTNTKMLAEAPKSQWLTLTVMFCPTVKYLDTVTDALQDNAAVAVTVLVGKERAYETVMVPPKAASSLLLLEAALALFC